MQVNLTRGNIWKNMIRFSLPYLLSYFLQTLYGLADLFIAGQYNGADVISAVSIGSQVMHMVTVMIVGLAMGSAVMIGRAVGAEDKKRVRDTIGSTIVLFIFVAAATAVLLLVFTRGVVSVLSTPAESVSDTMDYLHICFAGIPFIVAYNVISSIFRGMGDSKSPMIFVSIACAVNIFLDIVFMGPLHMRAAGAAWGTVIAQAVSVLAALFGILRRNTGIKLTQENFRFHRSLMKAILGIGVPIMFQDGFIQISFLMITVIANHRGVEISAAVGIVEKTISFLFLVPSTMLSTVSTIAAQCFGARDQKRAEQTLTCGVIIAAALGAFFAVIFQFISKPVFSLFTSDEAVRDYAVQYMKTYVLDCVAAGVHFPFSGFFSAAGVSILSFVHNIISVVGIRIPGAYFATRYFPGTLYAMGLAAPCGSLVSDILCVIFYRHLKKSSRDIKNRT